MKTTKILSALCTLLLAGAGSAFADKLDVHKSVGNNDTGADLDFGVTLRDGDDWLIDNHYRSSQFFFSQGRVLGKTRTIVDIGAKAHNHDGGINLYGQYVPASSGAHVWFTVAGIEICDVKKDGNNVTAYWSDTAIIPITGISKNYTLGIFTLKVSAGINVSLTPELRGKTVRSEQKAVSTSGMSAGVNATASGKITAGGLGGVKVTCNVELVSLGCDLVGTAKPGVADASIVIGGDAMTLTIKLKAWVIGGATYKETLVDKSVASWERDIAL